MTSFSVDQKLRLASALREEQEKNQFSLKKREAILSGEPFLSKPSLSEKEKSLQEDTIHSTFRIRFFLALLLFVGFLWFDTANLSIRDVDSTVIYHRIQEDKMSSFREILPEFVESST